MLSFPYRIFSKLNHGHNNLFDAYKESVLKSKCIVKFDDNKGYYKFTIFDGVWGMYKHIKNTQPSKRHFFETVTYLTCRKPHFDLDFILDHPKDLINKHVVSEVVKACVAVMKLYNCELSVDNDVVLLSSHGWKDDKYKVSYHIIIDNWYVQTHLHAKQFCREVISQMEQYVEYVDDKIYSSIRQFRMVGNCKYGSTRYLIHVKKWKYFDQEVIYSKEGEYKVFAASIIGNTGSCQKIDIPLPEVSSNYNTVELRSDEADQAVASLRAYLDRTGYTLQFNIREINGRLIVLNRLDGSTCPICNTRHESDNPYLLLTSDGSVLYSCRRSESTINVGCVDNDDNMLNLDDNVYFIDDLIPSTTRRVRRTLPRRDVRIIENTETSLSESDSDSYSI